MISNTITIPLEIEHNRPFIELDLQDSMGQWQKARTWVDTGGGSFIIAKALADRLGIQTHGDPFEAEGSRFIRLARCPGVQAGGLPIALDEERTFIALDDPFLGGVHRGVEAFFPGHVLKSFYTTFDYHDGHFSLTATATSPPPGQQPQDLVHTPIHPKTAFPRVEVEIAGERYAMLLDTGASYTMVSQALIDRWKEEHPDWPWVVGAVGPANMTAHDARLTMMRVPTLRVGRHELAHVGVISRPKGTFETWMSPMMTEPVVGALAGNVLRCFQLSIDYPNEQTYFKPIVQPDSHECEMVGLTLRQTDRGCVIAAARPYLRDLLRLDDRIMAVDGLDVSHESMPVVVHALRGRQGSHRTIEILRNGEQLSVQAPIRRII